MINIPIRQDVLDAVSATWAQCRKRHADLITGLVLKRVDHADAEPGP